MGATRSNYRLYFPDSKKVVVSRHMVFNEKCKSSDSVAIDPDDGEITIPFDRTERRVEDNEQRRRNDTVE